MRRSVLCLALLSAVVPVWAEEPALRIARPADRVRIIIELREKPQRDLRGGISSDAVGTLARAQEELQATLERSGTKVEHRFTRVFAGASATVRRSEVEAIRKLPYVARVHEDRELRATLAESVSATRADLVWETYATRGEGVVVAVLDTGVDWHHAAFGGAFGPGQRVAGGWDFVNGDADPDDDHGHGTHVAGILAANGGGLTGVAPGATLLAYKVLDQSGFGRASHIIAALERAVDPDGNGNPSDHVDVINMSLGGGGPSDDPLVTAVENAVAAGCVVVVSAGNTGSFYEMGVPAMAPSAITVGAIDRQNALAAFSAKGPAPELLLVKPEVVAPGVGIVSAKRGGGTTPISGTSMAAPHVAGVAALLRAISPQRTPAEIKSALTSTAIPLGGEVMAEGAGRIDAFAAAEAEVLTSPAIISFGRTSGSPDQWTSTVSVSLSNRSDEAQILFLSTTTGEKTGIDITVLPSVVQLAAGETKQVTVSVRVDNKIIAAPTEGSLSFGGAVTFEGEQAVVRIPWAFVKAGNLTVDWTSEMPVEVSIVGDQVVRRFVAGGPVKRTAFLPATSYDVTLLSLDSGFTTIPDGRGRKVNAETPTNEPILVVFENVSAAGDPILSATAEMAKNVITLASVDENGQPLAAESGVQCTRNLILDFAAGRSRLFDLQLFSFDADRAHVSDLHSIRTLAMEECVDPSRSSIYAADHDVPLPLTGNVTLRNEPHAYLATPFHVFAPSTIENPSVNVWAGPYRRTDGGGYSYSPLLARIPIQDSWSGTLFLSPELHDNVSGSAHLGVGPEGSIDGVISWPFYRQGDRVAAGRGITPVPDEFSAERGERITIGNGPLFPDSITGARSDFFWSFVEWKGPLGESYSFDALRQTYELFDEAGTLVRSGTRDICCDPIPPGYYRVVTRASVTTSSGSQLSMLTKTFDTRRADYAPPTMTMMRFVESDGRTSTRLHEGGAMLFSVQDWMVNQFLEGSTVPMPADTVEVFWRPRGQASWTPATPVLTADDQPPYEILGHPPTGLHFRVDLAAAIRTRGPIDIRITSADESGNTAEWIGESVFSASESRRRSARH